MLVLYKQVLSFFLALSDGILNIPGIKFNPNGYTIDKIKLIKVSYEILSPFKNKIIIYIYNKLILFVYLHIQHKNRK